jgi:cellular nucleic acid-binding protein
MAEVNDEVDERNATNTSLETEVSGESVPSSMESDRKRSPEDLEETDKSNDSSRPRIAVPAGLDRLSKWAARLFDPDRPRGLIQPPQTIPLNDEFLREFGRREKHSDQVRGVQLEIDRQIDDDDATAIATSESATQKSRDRRRKVKIVNLRYTTTSETLEKTCAEFGPIETVNLIMNPAATGDNRNAGHGYVLFANAESAQNCVDNLKHIDGRNVVVTLASSSKNASNAGSALSNRYWDAPNKDLSTRCFHCGNIGHIAADCTNNRRIKPCPLCADLGHHDQPRLCPMRNVCFTCGVPGHVSRECRWTQQQNPRRNAQFPLPRRIICTVCYDHRHHRSQCRAGLSSSRNVIAPPSAPAAVCFTCGNVGHYMCKNIEWRFGLRGISCANCGMPGHNVFQCSRPNLDQCARSNETWQHEIERASTVSFVEEYIVEINKNNPQAQQPSQQKQPLRKDPRGRSRDQNGNHRQLGQNRPFHSMPPPKKRSNGNPNPPSPPSQAKRQSSNNDKKNNYNSSSNNNNNDKNDRDPRKRSFPSKNKSSTPPPQKKQKNHWKSPPNRAESR